MRRLQATEMSASVTRSPTRKVFVNSALFNTVKDFFMSSMALSVAFEHKEDNKNKSIKGS